MSRDGGAAEAREVERLTARIVGRVQGVGFRYWALRQANGLGIVGWIMNDDDERSVEVVAEGRPIALDAFERLLRSGPPGARVERLDGTREAARGGMARFEIMRG
jgi:acylphosphatase